MQGSVITPARTIQFDAERGLGVQLASFGAKERTDVVFFSESQGKRDALVASAASHWQQPTRVDLPEQPFFVQVFDWDGDGTPEIVYAVPNTGQVVAVHTRPGEPKAESTAVLFSQEELKTAAASGGFHAKVNADGIEDYGFWYPEKHLLAVIFPKEPQAGVEDSEALNLTLGPTSDVKDMVVADLDRDGSNRLIASLGPGAQDSVAILSLSRNAKEPSRKVSLKFQTESPTTTVEVESQDTGASASKYLDLGVTSLAVDDVDEDGLMDIVTANGFAGTVSIAFNKGHDQYLIRSYKLEFPGAKRIPSVTSVALVDADGDRHLDLHILATIQKPDDTFIDTIIVARGNGKGGFTGSGYLELSGSVTGMTIADLDGNGVPDYALVGSPLRIVFR